MTTTANPVWSERLPRDTSAYDPNAQPYTAPEPPPIQAPPQLPAEQTQQPKAPAVARSGGGLATAAFGLDSILKGYMRGREQAQQKQAYKAQQLSNGMRYAYETAAQNYIELIKSGKPANDPEVQKADAAQKAAYTALTQMQGNWIKNAAGIKQKKSKGGESGGNSDQPDPMQLITSADPKQKIYGAWLLQQKMLQQGITPANAAARQYLTPEYQAQKKLYQSEQSLTQGNVDDKLALRNLEMADTSKMTPEQKTAHDQQVQSLRDRVSEVSTGYSQKEKIIDRKVTPDNHQWVMFQDAAGHTRWEDQGEQRGFASQIAKPGSEQEYIERVAKESGVPEKDLSADSLLKLRQSFAASNQMGKVVSRNYVYTDKETGQIIVVPLTSTTTPIGEGKGVPQVHASGTAAPAASAKSGSSGASSGGAAASTSPAAAGTTAASTSDQLPAGSPKGAHVIGQTLSQPKAKAQATTNDTYKKMKPLFGLLSAQEDYMKEVTADPGKATPRQDLSLVVAAVRSMNPGSVRLPQKELELEVQAGSYGDRAKRWYDNATTGLLPEDQRKDLFGIVQRETIKAGESIAADWQQNMSGQPLPNDIKRFAKGGGATGGAGDPTAETPEQKQLLDKYFPPAPAPK